MPFTNPKSNVAKLGLTESMSVADFGAGSGEYARAAARQVGNTGRVFAIDIQKDVLAALKSHPVPGEASAEIETIWGDIERSGGAKIGNESVDAVILSNTLFQVEEKGTLIDEAARVLKPDGKLLLVDWTDSHGHLGPHPDHVVTEEYAVALFEAHGFTAAERFPAGDHHYGVIFRKAL